MQDLTTMTEDQLIDEYSHWRTMEEARGRAYDRYCNGVNAEMAWADYKEAGNLAKAAYDEMKRQNIRICRRTF